MPKSRLLEILLSVLKIVTSQYQLYTSSKKNATYFLRKNVEDNVPSFCWGFACVSRTMFFWGDVVPRGHRHLGALAAAECCLAHARRVGAVIKTPVGWVIQWIILPECKHRYQQ